LRVDRTNQLAFEHWHEKNPAQTVPPFKLPTAPPGAGAGLPAGDRPGNAGRPDHLVDTNRQVSYGDFGGGIGDDSDDLNWRPGLAMVVSLTAPGR
jgi:hypothetical protein